MAKLLPMTSQRPLSLRRKKFCMSYLSDPLRRATHAAMEAGYSEAWAKKNSYLLLKDQQIQDYISMAEEQVEKDCGITYEWKLKKLKQVAELSTPDSAISIEDIKPQYTIAAISEMNKMQGHYAGEKRKDTSLTSDEEQQAQEALELVLKQYENPY